MNDMSKKQGNIDTSTQRVYDVLAKWQRRAAFFVGKYDRLTPAEQAIYCECIDDLRAALGSEDAA